MIFFNFFYKIYLSGKKYRDELILSSILFFLFIVAINTKSGWLYILISIFLSIFIISFIYPRFKIKDLVIRRFLPLDAFEDDEITVKLLFESNKNIFPFIIYESSPFGDEEFLFFVPPLKNKEKFFVNYKLKLKKRGIYNFSCAKLECSLLGLFSYLHKISIPSTLIVFPKGPDIHHLSVYSSFISLGYNKAFSIPGESFDFLGIKEHQGQESLRHIHWPYTAKRGELMVKEFIRQSSRHITFYLDNYYQSEVGEGNETTLEYMIKGMVGLGKFAIKRGIPLECFIQDGADILHFKRLKMYQFLKILAGINSNGEFNFNEFLEKNADKIRSSSQLIIFLTYPVINQEALLFLKNKKILLKVILFKAYTFADSKLKIYQEEKYKKLVLNLEDLGIPVKTFSKGEDLKKCLTAIISNY
ncbi:MAG: DUF58 domain-containing protein [Armatimonadetes bacterium]|nr:DUF58 domain-containing protein [Armatimonadota bacterium]